MFRWLLIIVCFSYGQLSLAVAENRIALLIGNSKYVFENELFTPQRDIPLIETALRKAGFNDVRVVENGDRQTMMTELQAFSVRADAAEVALIYFAGHGFEIGGINYLVPVNAKLRKASDASFEAIDLANIRNSVSGASKLRMVVLDACRNNPFPLEARDGTRSSRKIGLIEVKPGVNELIAFSAQQGVVADDGPKDGNSPFAAALAKWLVEAGLEIRFVMGHVRDDVMNSTTSTSERDGPQIPYIQGSLGGEPIVFRKHSSMDIKSDVSDVANEQPLETRQAQSDFDEAFGSASIEKLAIFINTYEYVVSQSDNVKFALLQMDKLRKQQRPSLTIAKPVTRTLDLVKARGNLLCGVSLDVITFAVSGLSSIDDQNNYVGVHSDTCRAIAAAIFGGPSYARFAVITDRERFTALQSEDIDILVHNTAYTREREDHLRIDFVGANLFDSRAIMVRKNIHISTVASLSGVNICLQESDEYEISNYFKSKNLDLKMILRLNLRDALADYKTGRCDAVAGYANALLASRLDFIDPNEHLLLPEHLSDDKIGPYVRKGDDNWLRITSAVLSALLKAEELGITSQNLYEVKSDTNPEIEGFFKNENIDLGLSQGWTENVIRATGNYGEIYARNLGASSLLNLPRGLNALSRDGGLMFP